MNLLDLPLRVILAGWLLRRVSAKRTYKVTRILPGHVLESERQAIGTIEEGLVLYLPSRLQRLCLGVLTRFLESETEAYRKLISFETWHVRKG